MIRGINCVDAMRLSVKDLDRSFTEIKTLGFTHVRVEMIWADIEKTQRKYTWDAVKRVAEWANTYGLSIVWVLGVHEPKWGFFGFVDTTNSTDYQAFCTAATASWGTHPTTSAFEIWNEQNAVSYFGSKNMLGMKSAVDAKAYAVYLSKAFDAIKSINPALPVISGGLMACPTNPWQPTNLSPNEFLAKTLAPLTKPNVQGKYDYLGYHAYSYVWDTGATSADCEPNISVRWLNEMDRLRDVMEKNGGVKPIAITEWGLDWAQSKSTANAYDWLIKYWTLIEDGYGDLVNSHFLYCIRDAGGQSYGLFKTDWTPKPVVYDTVKALLVNGLPD